MARLKTTLCVLTLCSALESVKILGVFNKQEDVDIFTQTTQQLARNTRSQAIFLSNITDIPMLVQTLCEARKDAILVYVIATQPEIQLVHLATSNWGLPVLAFNVDEEHSLTQQQRFCQLPHQFSGGYDLYHEGVTMGLIADLSSIGHIYALVEHDIQHDGFLAGFREIYVDEFRNLLEVVQTRRRYSENAVLLSLLQGVKEQARSQDIILLHVRPELVDQVIRLSNLFFPSCNIVWLISSYGQPLQREDPEEGLIALQKPPIDARFITESIAKIYEEITQHEKTDLNHQIHKSSDGDDDLSGGQIVDGCNTNVELTPDGWRWFASSSLVHRDIFKYTPYNLYLSTGVISPADGDTVVDWKKSVVVDVFNRSTYIRPLSIIRPFAFVRMPKKYTVVTIIDKPFVTEKSPMMVDGETRCSMPAVECLRIPEEVIEESGRGQQIIGAIFEVLKYTRALSLHQKLTQVLLMSYDYTHGMYHENRTYNISCCEGISIDLLASLSNDLKFDYQVYVVPDGEFGGYNLLKQRWTGLVRELVEGRADMAVASFSITSLRDTMIDYSTPYYYSGFSMLSIERENADSHTWFMFAFLAPYPLELWLAILAMMFFTSLCLAILDWFSPHGMNPSRNPKERSYTLASAIKTSWGQLCGNNMPNKTPKAWPARSLYGFWSGFSIVILSGFTANLTSAIAVKWNVTPLSGVYDPQLLKLRVAAPKHSAVESYIKMIRPNLYEHIRKRDISDTNAGVQALRNNQIDVFLHDAPVIEYLASRENFDCQLVKMGTFATDTYGIGFPKDGFPSLKKAITSKLLEYQASGYIDKLRRTFFPLSPNCINPAAAENIRLSLNEAAGMFVIVLVLIGFCFLLIGSEHLTYSYFIPRLKGKAYDSCWKSSKLFFFSQRLYRSIQGEGSTGRSVFTNFARRLLDNAKNLPAVGQKAKAVAKLSLSIRKSDPIHKLTFYDVVNLAYQKKYNRHIETIFLPRPSRVHKKLLKHSRELALSMAGFHHLLDRDRQYLAKLMSQNKNTSTSVDPTTSTTQSGQSHASRHVHISAVPTHSDYSNPYTNIDDVIIRCDSDSSSTSDHDNYMYMGQDLLENYMKSDEEELPTTVDSNNDLLHVDNTFKPSVWRSLHEGRPHCTKGRKGRFLKKGDCAMNSNCGDRTKGDNSRINGDCMHSSDNTAFQDG